MKKLKYLIFAFVAMVMMATGVFAAGEKVKITIIDNIYQCPAKYKTASGKEVKLTEAQRTNKLVYTINKGATIPKEHVNRINQWIKKRRAVYLKYLTDIKKKSKRVYIKKVGVYKRYDERENAEMYTAQLPYGSGFSSKKWYTNKTLYFEKIPINAVVRYVDRYYLTYVNGNDAVPDKYREFEVVRDTVYLKKGEKIPLPKKDTFDGYTFKANTVERYYDNTDKTDVYSREFEKDGTKITVDKIGQMYFVCRNYQENKYNIIYSEKSSGNYFGSNGKKVEFGPVYYNQAVVLPGCLSGSNKQIVAFKGSKTRFEKNGYKFKSWNVNGSSRSTGTKLKRLSKNDNAKVTISAEWTPITYQIKYKITYNGKKFEALNKTNNGGNPTTYTIESSRKTIDEIERKGYKFLGWQSNIFSGKKTSFTIPKDQTGTVYATAYFEPAGVLSINPDGGNYIENGKIVASTKFERKGVKGHTYKLLSMKDKEDRYNRKYYFDGWQFEAAKTNGGTLGKASVNSNGSRFWTYTFGEAEDSVKAIWKRYLTLVILPNGGVYDGDTTLSGKKAGAKITLKTPTRNGYDFDGWSINNSSGRISGNTFIFDENATSDVKITAKWKQVKTFTLTIKPNGGVYNGATVLSGKKAGDKITLATPTKTNYDFVGWSVNNSSGRISDNGNTFIFDENATSSVTITANWKELPVLIVNPAGGECNGTTNKSKYWLHVGESVAVSLPRRNDYTFIKWEIDKKNYGTFGNGKFTLTKETANITLTATWKPKLYLIIKPNGGKYNKQPSDKSFYTYPKGTIKFSLPTRDEYIFDGWKASRSDVGTISTDGKSFTFDDDLNKSVTVTLTAQWKVKK